MPRPSEGARLYLRKRKGRASVWVIKDGIHEQSTGTDDRGAAESALSRYIATRGMPSGPVGPEGMTVGQALTLYGEGHAKTVTAPERIGYAIEALDRFWGDLTVSSVKGETCRRYKASRTRTFLDGSTAPISDGTVRRELGVLQAAMNYCVREGYLLSAPLVTLPEKPQAKERWLRRDEMAWLLRAARNLRIDGQHLAKFIVTGRYTGTRRQAILALGIDRPSVNGGWIDTEAGIIYRAGQGNRRTKKRQPSVRLPGPFLAHVKRWKARGCTWVVEDYRGNRVGDIKKGWRGACELAAELAAEKSVTLDFSDVTPHTLRHTAITWAMQAGADKWDVAGYFGVSLQTLESVYGHHHPDHQGSAVRAMEKNVSGAGPRNEVGAKVRPKQKR